MFDFIDEEKAGKSRFTLNSMTLSYFSLPTFHLTGGPHTTEKESSENCVYLLIDMSKFCFAILIYIVLFLN